MRTRTVALVLAVLLIAGIANWVRQGDTFHIAKVLPFCSGRPPGIYDLAGIVIIVLLIRGLRRLRSSAEDDAK